MRSGELTREVWRRWPCTCPLCKLLVVPLAGVYALARAGVKEMEAAEKREEAGAPQAHRDVGEQLKELRETIEGLKEALVDIKALLSEVNNPFVILRKAGEEELRKVAEAAEGAQPRPAPIPASAPAGSEYGAEDQAAVREGVGSTGPAHRSEREATGLGGEVRRALEPIASASGVVLSLGRLLKLLELLSNLYDMVPPKLVKNVITLYVKAGVLSREQGRVLRRVAALADEFKAQGLDFKRQLIIMYALARALGVRDEGLEDEVALRVLLSVGDLLRGGEAGSVLWNNNEGRVG